MVRIVDNLRARFSLLTTLRDLAVLAAALLTLPATAVRAADHPNVVVVITDDQGYGDVGIHGNEEIRTPAMDALARSSLRLTNFHVEPTCAETRAALLTGQFPLRNGVWHTIMGRSILRKSAVTLPQLFQQAGYRTGMFGKWHLGDNAPFRPQDRGFDQTLRHGGGGVTQLPDVWGNDYFDDVYWAGDQLLPVRGYCTDVFFDAAKEFIKAESDRPFFCYLATNAPHSPYNVADAYKKPYADQGIADPRASFYGMITNIDDNLAQLLALLDDRGLAENTIVVFMTDNGSAAGYVPAKNSQPEQGFNAGMRGTKVSQYDGGHRVPCFIRYARALPSDRDFDKLCAHVDIVPTLAQLCSLDSSAIQPLDGRSLVDAVQSDSAEASWPQRTLVVQVHRVEEPVQWHKSAVMTQRWRLVDGEELYDMQSDPSQRQPVVGKEAQQTKAELRSAYERWWQEMKVDSSDYSSIELGGETSERVRLTAHDWHGPQPVVMQNEVLNDPATRGFWAVEVMRPGVYQFLLARRPLEQPGPIACTHARVTVGGKASEQTTDPTAVLAPITMRLPAGKTHLETQLIDANGTITGAYFVTVNFLGDIPQGEIESQATRLPNWLSPGDRVAWVGGTLIERAAESGILETEMLLRAPLAALTFVNLGWSGDDFTGRARAVFGSTDDGQTRRGDDLQLAGASLVMIAYGMSELLDSQMDETRVEGYETSLRELVQTVRSQRRRVVLCLPPELICDSPASKDRPNEVTCAAYEERRLKLLSMLEQVATDLKIPTTVLPAIPTSHFETGTYLSREGYRDWGTRVGEALFAGAANSQVSSRSDETQLMSLAGEAARLFFDMHRPQNETYLRLFRKHEQGNNAVEIGQYRPLVAEAQFEMIHAAAKQVH